MKFESFLATIIFFISKLKKLKFKNFLLQLKPIKIFKRNQSNRTHTVFVRVHFIL